uniref:protein ENDOSPERM DEFECTIVE 1-like n=1 Tax=Erigeron canadensis TaxID=72917 RepID=UPI001CB8A26B|nr:protein ENDOSPERM DEFECTIVE 1-like [Erigeron canadensis]
MSNPSIGSADTPAPSVRPQQQHRKPRVREVSSRFMSPSPSNSSFSSSSSAAGDLHSFTIKTPKPSPNNNNSNRYSPAPTDNRSSKPSSSRRLLLPHRASQDNLQPPFSSNHENIPETIRSMDYGFSTTHKKPQQQPRALFKENDIPKSSSSSTNFKPTKSSRSDTPVPTTCDRIVPSRFRLPQQNHNRQTAAVASDATKLLQSTVSLPKNESESNSCPNSPMYPRTWPLPDTRSSFSDDEEDRLLPSRSFRRTSSTIVDGSGQTKFSTPNSLCSRSVNLPISLKTSKPPLSSAASTTMLPPQPTSTKTGVGLKKGKKPPQASPEDVHSLKLLHNHFLQWRFANAKAQAAMHSQTKQMENQFFSLGTDIANLRDTVKRKQAELNELQRIKAVSAIVEAQMPYLDQWSDLEEDYTCSLSGATNALSNSLLRLPVSGNVQVNTKEIAVALDSAAKTTDMIVHNMLSLLPKAEETDTLTSELANVVDTEKALVEECENLLLTTHNLQVEDCSLRGQLMQLKM